MTTYFGGFNDVRAAQSILAMASFSIAVALPIPFISNPKILLVLLWLLLFSGASVLPGLSGIMLNTIE